MDLRSQIVTEAKSWIGTPFEHGQCKKGVGCDCATILNGVYSRFFGYEIKLPYYDIQWNLHSDSQPYLTALMTHCREVSAFEHEVFVPEVISTSPKFRGFPMELWDKKPPLPADVCLWWFGRTWAHTTIVLDWPTVLNPLMYSRVSPELAHTIGSHALRAGRAGRMRLMRPKILL
jgi:cell wall-associated NlpC family hydrolase